jgi:regulatory protein
MRRTTIDSSENTAEAAWAAAVRMLARRELSAAQVRERLARRGWTEAAIEPALARLAASGTLDDARVALACARTRSGVKRQGRDRVLREIQALGVAREVARAAVDEVFGALDEGDLLKVALEKRLRPGMVLSDPAVQRRLYAALGRQGFDAHAVGRAIRERAHKDGKRNSREGK